jgi:hypothetical protein
MKKSAALTLFTMTLCFCAMAAGDQYYNNYSRYATPSYNTPTYNNWTHNYVTAALGFMAPGNNALVGTVNGVSQPPVTFANSGLIGVGAEYDYMFKKTFSFGAFLRYYNVSTTVPVTATTNATVKNSLFAIGPQVKAYLPVGPWTPYITTGLSYMAPDYTLTGGNNQTLDYNISNSIGLMFGLGILYPLTDSISVGIENMRLIGLSAGTNGIPIDDLMLKGRFGF